jgi:hypothetical protein
MSSSKATVAPHTALYSIDNSQLINMFRRTRVKGRPAPRLPIQVVAGDRPWRIHFMRKWVGFLICVAAFSTACGGHNGTPTSPSSNSSSSSASAATISGTLQGAGASALTAASGGAALSGITVTLVGTSISSGVDAAGRFTLVNVPPGGVQLRISGGGVDATVTLTPVQAAETVEIVVVVSGSTANVESEIRNGGSESQLEGRVESLPPTTAALTFMAAGRTVTTDASTQFVDGGRTRSFSDLRVGMRVHVKGQMSGTTFMATSVQMQNSNTAVPVNVNGIIDSVTGTASSFQFNIGSRVIRGDSTTSFSGQGKSAADGFASLKSGVRVEVKGEQRDGFIFATKIHINDNDNDDDQDDDEDEEENEVELRGTLTNLTNACPDIHFTVQGTAVVASASTRFDKVSCSALKNDDRVEVKGTRQTDGSVSATRIKKD